MSHETTVHKAGNFKLNHTTSSFWLGWKYERHLLQHSSWLVHWWHQHSASCVSSSSCTFSASFAYVHMQVYLFIFALIKLKYINFLPMSLGQIGTVNRIFRCILIKQSFAVCIRSQNGSILSSAIIYLQFSFNFRCRVQLQRVELQML